MKHQPKGVTSSNQVAEATIDDPTSSDARADHRRARLSSGRELTEVAVRGGASKRVELPLNRGEAATESLVVFHDAGAEDSRSDATSEWHLEPGSNPIARVNGKLVKAGTDQFRRMTSIERFGGPGKTLKVSYRARAKPIRDRPGSPIVEGVKVGLKWPGSSSVTGYATGDPRSVHGSASQADPAGPGSYAFPTGLTQGGHIELSRDGRGSEGYEFFPRKLADYTPGTWQDVVVTVEWLADREIRVRHWQNADASGKPIDEATNSESPLWAEPGYLWLRTDDANWEYDFIKVEETTANQEGDTRGESPSDGLSSKPQDLEDSTSPPLDLKTPDRAASRWPTEKSTGVPADVELTPSKSIVVTEDGTVIDARHVTGTVTVRADDVTIKRSRITNTGRYPIRLDGGSGLVVEDVEIDGQGIGSAAACCADYTLRRVNIHSVTEGPRVGSDTTVEDSYIHHLVRCPDKSFSDGCHVDALQTTGGDGMTIRGNNIQAYNPDTDDPMNAAFMIGEESKPVRDCLVEGNLLNGGSLTINAGGGGTRGAQCTFRDNAFGDDHRYGTVGNLGPGISWADTNEQEGTGQPVR